MCVFNIRPLFIGTLNITGNIFKPDLLNVFTQVQINLAINQLIRQRITLEFFTFCYTKAKKGRNSLFMVVSFLLDVHERIKAVLKTVQATKVMR